VVEDLLASRGGRSLPFDPGSWTTVLFTSGFVLAAAYVVVGAYLWRRHTHEVVPRVLVACGVFTLGILPTVLYRPDLSHVRPFAILGLALFPGAVLFAVKRWARLTEAQRLAVAVAVALVAVYPVLSELSDTARLVREGRGIRTGNFHFYVDEQRGDGGRAVVARASQLAHPGDSLFVGPQDLRRTNYNPAFMYFLLRHLRPASYYMELNPGTANRVDSGLADELREADWLILTTAWDDWNEPNESMDYGSSEPNQVVRDDFCLRFEHVPYRLYERCDRAA
jgi:hypothetical protein